MSRNTRRKLVIPQSNDLDGEKMEKATEKDKRILDLTSIKDIDKGVPDYPYWKENFKIVDDKVQFEYNRIVSEYEDILPPIFFNGVASLEPKAPIVLKKSITFKDLKAGKYHTAGSNSDEGIASNITTFVNNLKEFERYKNKADFKLDWIVLEHRTLLTDLLVYHFNKKNRLPTIKTWINAMMRVIGICLTKQHELYEKYASVMKALKEWVNFSEGDNTLNPNEIDRFIPWDYVMLEQRNLQQLFDGIENKKTKPAFAVNQDLLLLSLYCLIPPLRAEVKTLKFTKTRQDKGDWIFFYNNDIVLELNEMKKKHDYIRLQLPEDLKAIIRQSYELYPREAVFVDKNKYPQMKQVSVKTLDGRMADMFRKYGVRVGSSVLRSSYVTHMESLHDLTYNQRQNIARQMRTSSEQMLLSYKKIFNNVQAVEAVPVLSADNVTLGPSAVEAQPVAPIETKVAKAYNKHLENNRIYYNKNKEEILQKQKAYHGSLDKKEQARKKILYFLNNDDEYHKRVRKSTMDKYKFKKQGSVWV